VASVVTQSAGSAPPTGATHYERVSEYEGTFWRYHLSTSGNGTVWESRIDIRHSLLRNRLEVRTGKGSDSVQDNLRYVGYASKRESMIRYFQLREISPLTKC
jgi:hypothetical protein